MNSHAPPWSVSTLIDLEYALLRDPVGDRMRRWRRDREIYTSFQEHTASRTHASRRAAFAYWLQAVRMQRAPLPGPSIVRACDILATILIVLSFFCGLSYAGALLVALDNRGHVSAVEVLMLTIGLQVLVLLVGALTTLVRARRSDDGAAGSIRLWLLLGLLERFGRLRAPLRTLASLQPKYRSLLVANFFKKSQSCVAAFSLGIVVSLVAYHFAVREVRFGWTATHDFTAEEMSRAVDVVASPWAWLIPRARPSSSQVSDSRLTRERPDTVVSPETSRAWAAFLVMSLLTYGVVFRILLVALASNWAQRKVAASKFDGAAANELWDRMTSDPPPEPQAETPAPTPAPPPPRRPPWWKKIFTRLLAAERRYLPRAAGASDREESV